MGSFVGKGGSLICPQAQKNQPGIPGLALKYNYISLYGLTQVLNQQNLSVLILQCGL